MPTETFDLVTPGSGGSIAIPSGFLGIGLPALKNGHTFTAGHEYVRINKWRTEITAGGLIQFTAPTTGGTWDTDLPSPLYFTSPQDAVATLSAPSGNYYAEYTFDPPWDLSWLAGDTPVDLGTSPSLTDEIMRVVVQFGGTITSAVVEYVTAAGPPQLLRYEAVTSPVEVNSTSSFDLQDVLSGFPYSPTSIRHIRAVLEPSSGSTEIRIGNPDGLVTIDDGTVGGVAIDFTPDLTAELELVAHRRFNNWTAIGSDDWSDTTEPMLTFQTTPGGSPYDVTAYDVWYYSDEYVPPTGGGIYRDGRVHLS